MLMILAVFSIFFGFITKDMFIGLGSGFFSDNALFIHPSHEIMLDTEFGVPTLFKLLPLIFTISLSVIAIVLSEYLSTILIYFKLSRVGYNIFSFFNQRFLIELFYNRYITGIVLKLGGQTTKVIDKGSVEYLGPYGLEKGLLNISNNIARLNTGVITSYALYILIGLITYLLFNSYINSSNIILVLLISLSLALFGTYKHNAHILTSSPPLAEILDAYPIFREFMIHYCNAQMASYDISSVMIDVAEIDEETMRPFCYLENSFKPGEIKMLADYYAERAKYPITNEWRYGYHNNLGVILQVGWKVTYMLEHFQSVMEPQDKVAYVVYQDTLKLCQQDLNTYYMYKLKLETFMQNKPSMLIHEVSRLLSETNPFGVNR